MTRVLSEPADLANALAPQGDCHAKLADALMPHGRVLDLAQGQMLFHQGDAAKAIYFLLDGRLEVSILSEAGRKTALNVISPVQVFGELSLIEETTRSASVSALEPSRVQRISRSALLEVMAVNPSISVRLLQVVIGRARWISDQLEALSFQPLEVRLARRLLYLQHMLADDADGVDISQQSLGDHIGTTREAVAKVIAQWKRERLIDTYRGGILILRPDRLTELAGYTPL